MTQACFLYLVLSHTDVLIISCELSYACPYNLVSSHFNHWHFNHWFKHASGAEAKFGSQKWWQCGNSSEMIIGRQRSYLCGQGFERLSQGACTLLSIQNSLHFTLMLCYYIKDSKIQCMQLM